MSNESTSNSRRKFIQKVAGSVLASSIPGIIKATGKPDNFEGLLRNYYYPNDNIQIAVIGAGGMGTADGNTAMSVPGAKIIAACDLYDGRLEAAKKNYGKDIFTTKDYREILQRKDIDAVIVATPDHWHKDISVAAMNSGKAVYCEKPMVHEVSEGNAVVEAQNRNKVVMQVGSQGMSSLGNEKAKEL